MTPAEKDRRVEAITRHLSDGGSVASAAAELGIPQNTLRQWWRDNKIDPAVQSGMTALGMDTAPAGGWIKSHTPDENGLTYSFMLPKADPVDDTAERIAERMERITPVPAIPAPHHAPTDLLNFIPLYDVHLGQRVGSFGTAQAVSRLVYGFRDVIDRAPPAATIIILNGGDFSESNDNSALTPASKHPLAVDMEYTALIDIVVDVTIDLIEYALARADRVIYQALRANHDPATTIAIRQALRQRYRDNPRLEMPDGQDVFTYAWEGNFLVGIHGDQKNSKPESLALAIAARYAAAWGNATRREMWRGHNHKEVTVNVAGMRIHQVNPICPPGRYANENLFTGESDIQCITYRKGGGRRATSVHIFED